MAGILYGVSVGPGDPELITQKAVRIIRSCEYIAVPRSAKGNDLVAYNIALQSVPELKDKQITELYLPMTRDKMELERTRDEAAMSIESLLSMGKDVACLTLGDASVYSTYIYIHKRVKEHGFSAEIIPGVPSFCAVAAKLGDGLVEAEQPLHIIPASYAGTEEGLQWNGTKVLMKTGKSIEKVKHLLRVRGLYDKAKMVQKCGMDGERVFASMDEADDTASYFSIVVIKD